MTTKRLPLDEALKFPQCLKKILFCVFIDRHIKELLPLFRDLKSFWTRASTKCHKSKCKCCLLVFWPMLKIITTIQGLPLVNCLVMLCTCVLPLQPAPCYSNSYWEKINMLSKFAAYDLLNFCQNPLMEINQREYWKSRMKHTESKGLPSCSAAF